MSSPSIVPNVGGDVYLVLDDFGKLGRAYREVDEEQADRGTVVRNLTEGQYNSPVRIVCFNTDEGSARDVTEEIAREIQDRAASKGEDRAVQHRLTAAITSTSTMVSNPATTSQ